jgi:hypothetical protein
MQEQENIRDFIRKQLDLPPDAADVDIVSLFDSQNAALPLRPDIVFQSGGRLYFVEVKGNRPSLDTIARMNLQRELWQKKPGRQPVQLVLAVKTINAREEMLARDLDIRVVKIPWSVGTPAGREYQSGKIRISSQKSWRIVTRLIREKSTSIRQLALKEGVSYAWAHRVIGILHEQNVVKKEGGYVSISDMKNLFNGIAWERPMKNLEAAEIAIDFTGSHSAAREITRALRNEKIPFAFTTYTAGGLYTSYAIRQDLVSLYLEKDAIARFRENFGTEEENTVRAVIYTPDRDVFTDAGERESVMITSPSQTLLDLAGLGYGARDLTIAMAEIYAGL